MFLLRLRLLSASKIWLDAELTAIVQPDHTHVHILKHTHTHTRLSCSHASRWLMCIDESVCCLFGGHWSSFSSFYKICVFHVERTRSLWAWHTARRKLYLNRELHKETHTDLKIKDYFRRMLMNSSVFCHCSGEKKTEDFFLSLLSPLFLHVKECVSTGKQPGLRARTGR